MLLIDQSRPVRQDRLIDSHDPASVRAQVPAIILVTYTWLRAIAVVLKTAVRHARVEQRCRIQERRTLRISVNRNTKISLVADLRKKMRHVGELPVPSKPLVGLASQSSCTCLGEMGLGVYEPDYPALAHATPSAFHEAAIKVRLCASEQRAVDIAAQMLIHRGQRRTLVEVAHIARVQYLLAPLTNHCHRRPISQAEPRVVLSEHGHVVPGRPHPWWVAEL